ncbi:MAG: DUF58 domain-containing protein [Bacteroidales bacterium]|jgi:uncharacterized protein (DUF58 family)|nr:DUF58 domain-containing protein [Bacteroidales bacterium]
MEANELLKKVRKIEIRTRKLSQQIFSGEYHSAFKGLGMAFSEVRQYHYGDDTRFIDWNVTARFNHPYVKIFEEERELTVMLLIDVSGSNLFGTRVREKSELITEIAAVLAFSAIHNNDKVGVIFFSDKVEKFIPPKKGRSHILRVIMDLLTFEPESTRTNAGEAFRYLTNAIKKRCTAFVLSDFLNTDFEQPLKIAANKHDVIALNIADKGEFQLPDTGLMYLHDPETQQQLLVDTSDPVVRKSYEQWWRKQQSGIDTLWQKLGIHAGHFYTDEDYVKGLIALFRR